MSGFDRLLYELDGESAMRTDVATTKLEALLAEARTMSSTARIDLQTRVTALRQVASVDVEVTRQVHADRLAKLAVWERRAVEAPPSFAEEAKERVAAIRAEVEAVAAELAEHQATVRRLDEIYVLLDRAGRP